MRVTVLVSTLVTFSSSALATCYFPNGQVSPADTACNPNAIDSSCCYKNQACLSNGLCVSDPHNAELARLHRGTCTDQSWKSGNCVRSCLDTDNNGVPVYSCNVTDVDSYCCYDDCKCEQPFQVFSFSPSPTDLHTVTIIRESFTQTYSSKATAATSTSLLAVSSTSATSASSSTPASVSTSSTAPASTASAPAQAASESKGESSNHVALGVGLGLGLGVGVPAILLAAFFLLRRKKEYSPANGDSSMTDPSHEIYEPMANKYAYNYTAEVSGLSSASEMPVTADQAVELPSNQHHPSDAAAAQKYH